MATNWFAWSRRARANALEALREVQAARRVKIPWQRDGVTTLVESDER